MNSLIELGTLRVIEDDLRQQKRVPVYRTLYAEELPVRMSEFHAAAQHGLKPACAYRIWSVEYMGELLLRVDGQVYDVYRIYKDPKSGKTELYCEVRVGGD